MTPAGPRPLLFAPPGNEGMAAALAAALAADVGELHARRFPDGESYVRLLTSPMRRDVLIVDTLHPPDDRVLPLVFLADTARELGAIRVGLVAPYLAYMRQDARFHDGEAVTSRSFARIISSTFDWLVTADPHLHRYKTLDEIYACPAIAVRTAAALGEWIARNVERPLIVGPDRESLQWASTVAAVACAPVIVARKRRLGDAEVSVHVAGLTRYRDRMPVLVDDIISTADTMIEVVRHLREAGAPAPVCVAVHAVFAEGAYERLRAERIARVVTTNTIPHSSNAIDVSIRIAREVDAMLRWHPEAEELTEHLNSPLTTGARDMSDISESTKRALAQGRATARRAGTVARSAAIVAAKAGAAAAVAAGAAELERGWKESSPAAMKQKKRRALARAAAGAVVLTAASVAIARTRRKKGR
ncbi:MAG TPA: ribose-phosphate diphosphokinase [Gemmatimonadaceae bacterium]|nr:ribose-phosphate diphosphokinase [Gemmatimonadaceae bacterium]